jgi:hypothetical protein
MKIRPLNDYSEHDVINFFALDTATGAAGTLVKVKGSGFLNDANLTISQDMSTIKNAYIPRWEVPHKVTRVSSGELPLGFLRFEVKEVNFEGVSFKHDPTRKAEAQVVCSGEAVPVVRKGLFLVGDWPSGQVPLPGKAVVALDNGDWGVRSASASGDANVFGQCLGALDSKGDALVVVDFNRAR